MPISNFAAFFTNNEIGMLFHDYRLLADDSREIECLIFFLKKIVKLFQSFLSAAVVMSALRISDFIWPFYRLIWELFSIKKMAFILPISCILVLIFSIFMIYFPNCDGKGSFPKSQIKSLRIEMKQFYILYNSRMRHL